MDHLLREVIDMLLADRPLQGYPGVSVELHVDMNNFRVCVIDPHGTVEWLTSSRKRAKDMYFHPFVFGYEYGSETVYADGA